MSTKIQVVIENGEVKKVYSSDQNVEVHILDKDAVNHWATPGTVPEVTTPDGLLYDVCWEDDTSDIINGAFSPWWSDPELSDSECPFCGYEHFSNRPAPDEDVSDCPACGRSWRFLYEEMTDPDDEDTYTGELWLRGYEEVVK
jgi:hypothetical protein